MNEDLRPRPTLDSLKDLEPEHVISFLHMFDGINEGMSANQKLKVSLFVDGRVMRALDSCYGAKDDKSILSELRKIKERYDRDKQNNALAILKKGLKWPSDNNLTPKMQVTKFMESIKTVMGHKLNSDYAIMKQVVRVALKKTPKEYGLSHLELAEIPGKVESGRLDALPEEVAKALTHLDLKQTLLDQFEELLMRTAFGFQGETPEITNVSAVMDVAKPTQNTSENIAIEKFSVLMSGFDNKIEKGNNAIVEGLNKLANIVGNSQRYDRNNNNGNYRNYNRTGNSNNFNGSSNFNNGNSKCYNCLGDHFVRECNKPKDQARIRENLAKANGFTNSNNYNGYRNRNQAVMYPSAGNRGTP